MPEIFGNFVNELTWETILTIFDLMIAALTVYLMLDTINTLRSQKKIRSEMQNKKSQQKVRSKIVLDQVLTVLDTQWSLSKALQYIIPFSTAIIIVVLAVNFGQNIASNISRIVSFFSIVCTVIASAWSNCIVKDIRASKRNTN